ncbi:MAG: TlpA family protein disulfide reductase [Bacteroidales bacterium]|nr:TlpA family protein disulfide reductase [Bacteroidales bacterium]
MSRFSKIIIFVAAMMAAAACGTNAKIEGELSDAPSSEVVVKLLNINHYEVLDTLKTDAAGKFSYKAAVKKGQPEFIYVFYKDTKVATLLLEAGDKVSVTADTLGNYAVEGSAESVKLAQVEKDYADALLTLSDLSYLSLTAEGDQLDAIKRQMGQVYVDYYRNSVKYVMENNGSLTVVPVLFQHFGSDLPVFAQSTDALHFTNAADALELVYPESRYVKSLRAEAKRRQNIMEIENHLNSAEAIGYPDIELPDVNAQKVKLSDVDAKVVVVFFWTSSDASQKMFNLDFLKSIYEDYHKKGLEIYQVSLDPDKALWAKAVKGQNLPWINVCDSRGAASPYVALYNLSVLPAAYVIADGELVDGEMATEKSFRKRLDQLLK